MSFHPCSIDGILLIDALSSAHDEGFVRELIVNEIKRIAAENGGKAPGSNAFASETGISESKWRGIIWAKWGDAIADAGFEANSWQERYDSNELIRNVAVACRKLGKLPTYAEMNLLRRADSGIPSPKTVRNHFPGHGDLIAALRKLAETPEYADIAALLPEPKTEAAKPATRSQATDGIVYLLKSGQHYKIGRSDQIERRLKEITIALPETTTLIHSIRTDDAPGIEAYWHRRFTDRRANGEWFHLSSEDVKAFTRRTFM